jgi:hypothetical protein
LHVKPSFAIIYRPKSVFISYALIKLAVQPATLTACVVSIIIVDYTSIQ